MKELSLEEIKKIELDIMIYIDNFCRKNNIKYSLGGGSLLGAVRHNGFIPWDDDIDVNMVRDQYEKFVELFLKENGRYQIITYKTNEQYKYLFAKVVDTETILLEEHNNEVRNMGVFVDIFPIDALADSREDAINMLKSVKVKRFLGVAANWKHFYINHNRGVFRQIPRLVFYFCSRMVNVKKMYLWIESQFPFDENKEFWGCVCGSYEEKEIMPRNVFTEYMDMNFEGCSFMGICNYDIYLSNLYKDYMKLPPDDKRVTHHTFKVFKK